jgi:arylsulfatase A-like enzyme
MVSVVDSMLHNLTMALTNKQMWDDTIIVFLG